MSISSPIWTEKETYLLNYVSQERREKAMRYRNDSDKKLSLYAALLARFGLSLLTNVPNSNLIFSCSPNQKPILLSTPEVEIFSLCESNISIIFCDNADKGYSQFHVLCKKVSNLFFSNDEIPQL